ncbi:DUF2809 domain-containing protein [Candidatus Scalindua japonica]|uniref:DUF2809 domain-containing protein n=1 Tax=Candidatus Scalindua japonica TaxID=1284222 RepID=UPI002692DD5B
MRMICKGNVNSARVPRFYSFILLLIITPSGLASKFYTGPCSWWFNYYAGGILYEMFWCFVVILFFPYATAFWVTCSVFGATCLLECLQLWHPIFLEYIRSTFTGRTLIGTTFVWWDFPHYIIGCFASWLIIKLKTQKTEKQIWLK